MRAAPRAGRLRRGMALALLALGLAEAAQAESRRLTPEAAQLEAVRQLEAGNPQMAFGLAQALVARDATAFSAQLLLSYAARDLGRFDTSRTAARAALRLAQTEAQRHDATLALAQAQASAGRHTAAQLSLRRAIENAPTPQAKAGAIRDFRYVRARNPWTVQVDLGIAPGSNVNGGTEADTIWLYGLPFTLSGDAQALSGTGVQGAVSVARTVAETDRHLFRLGVTLAGQDYTLSSSARQKAPQAEGSDYAFWAVETHLTGRLRAGGAAGQRGDEWDMRLLAGHNDYGGAPLSNYASLALGRSFALGGGQSLHLGTSIERQWRRDAENRSAMLRFASLDWQRRLGTGVVSLGFDLGEVDSASGMVAHERKGLRLGHEWQKPIWGAKLRLNGGYERRDYGAMGPGLPDRTDHRLTVGADALLQNHDFMGFAPEVGLGYAQTNSNWALAKSEGATLSLRVKSAF